MTAKAGAPDGRTACTVDELPRGVPTSCCSSQSRADQARRRPRLAHSPVGVPALQAALTWWAMAWRAVIRAIPMSPRLARRSRWRALSDVADLLLGTAAARTGGHHPRAGPATAVNKAFSVSYIRRFLGCQVAGALGICGAQGAPWPFCMARGRLGKRR
jgi:hypothetical protein